MYRNEESKNKLHIIQFTYTLNYAVFALFSYNYLCSVHLLSKKDIKINVFVFLIPPCTPPTPDELYHFTQQQQQQNRGVRRYMRKV